MKMLPFLQYYNMDINIIKIYSNPSKYSNFISIITEIYHIFKLRRKTRKRAYPKPRYIAFQSSNIVSIIPPTSK